MTFSGQCWSAGVEKAKFDLKNLSGKLSSTTADQNDQKAREAVVADENLQGLILKAFICTFNFKVGRGITMMSSITLRLSLNLPNMDLKRRREAGKAEDEEEGEEKDHSLGDFKDEFIETFLFSIPHAALRREDFNNLTNVEQF